LIGRSDWDRAFTARAYPLQTHEMLFDATTQAFRFQGGAPRRGTFGNMKAAVDQDLLWQGAVGQRPVRLNGDSQVDTATGRITTQSTTPGFK
jgi:hypothetical protein